MVCTNVRLSKMTCLKKQIDLTLQSPSKQAAIKIVKNIFQYSQILNQASSKDVGQWSASSVHNAVHWALYCEEIYKYIHGQECEESLDHQLGQMAFLLEPASCLHLSLSSLQYATHLLVEAVLINPHTTPLLKDSIQKHLETIEGKTKTGKQVKERIESTQISIHVLQDLTSLLSSSMLNGNSKVMLSNLRTASELLLKRLVEGLRNSNSEERFQAYCSAICERIVGERTGWDLLVCCIAVDQNVLSHTERMTIKQVCDCILNWMAKKLKHSPDICPLWDVQPDILMKASKSNSTDFFKFYLLALDRWADAFQPTLDSVVPFHWRDVHGHTDANLTDHLKGLLLNTSDSSQASRLLDFLNEKLKTFDFAVWQTVAQNLLKDL